MQERGVSALLDFAEIDDVKDLGVTVLLAYPAPVLRCSFETLGNALTMCHRVAR